MRCEENEYKLYNWNEISNNFQNADLLLGNGFSIVMDHNYNTYEIFKSFYESLDDYNKNTFDTLMYLYVGSFCLEHHLEFLNNPYLNYPYDEEFYLSDCQAKDIEIKIQELIPKIIAKNHLIKPDNSKSELFINIADSFSQIFTLNFDLLLYYLILDFNNSGKRKFKDYFTFSKILSDKLLWFSDVSDKNDRFIHYLHGSIMLFANDNDTFKIKKYLCKNQLESINEILNIGKKPLFVFDGTSEKKMEKIKKNKYLTFCYDKLLNSKNKLVIFGASLDKVDKHIVEAINNNTKEIAISIYLGDPFFFETIYEQYLDKFKTSNAEIYFFDSKTFFE